MREDEVLCETWSTVSQDTVIGSNQTGMGMWRRIQSVFKSELPRNPADRTPDALASRWKLIQRFLNKFNGLVIAIENESPSGITHESRVWWLSTLNYFFFNLLFAFLILMLIFSVANCEAGVSVRDEESICLWRLLGHFTPVSKVECPVRNQDGKEAKGECRRRITSKSRLP